MFVIIQIRNNDGVLSDKDRLFSDREHLKLFLKTKSSAL